MEYTANYCGMLLQYAQGYVICKWLVDFGGPMNFVEFISQSVKHRTDWNTAALRVYGRGLDEIDRESKRWVMSGGQIPIPALVTQEVYYFGADYCPPCVGMKPWLSPLSKVHPRIRSCNVEREPEMVRAWNIKKLPTFVFIRDGKEIKRSIGKLPKQTLLDWANASEVRTTKLPQWNAPPPGYSGKVKQTYRYTTGAPRGWTAPICRNPFCMNPYCPNRLRARGLLPEQRNNAQGTVTYEG